MCIWIANLCKIDRVKVADLVSAKDSNGRMEAASMKGVENNLRNKEDQERPHESESGALSRIVIRDGIEVQIPVTDLRDTRNEMERLSKQLSALDKEIAALKKKLNNKLFLDRAPESMVGETKQKFQQKNREMEQVRKDLAISARDCQMSSWNSQNIIRIRTVCII